MTKPRTIDGYDAAVTEGCERVLVTLLRGLGPWKESVFLVGGLAPRYLVAARPPSVPRHAGTGDVDVVVDFAILTDTKAYQTLETNLKAMNFDRAQNETGAPQSWRWKTQIEGGATMVIEFLTDSPEFGGGKVTELPTDGNVSAINIPHSSIVFDLHDIADITVELLHGGGRTTERVRYANIVSFTCLKAFAFDHRAEPKDAHDLVYCIENYGGGVEKVCDAFKAALEGSHRDVILEAIDRLKTRFCDPDENESYLRDGPVAVARFEDNDAAIAEDQELRDLRILRQRSAADVIQAFIEGIG